MKIKNTKTIQDIQVKVPYTNFGLLNDAEHQKFVITLGDAYGFPPDWYRFVHVIQHRQAFQIQYNYRNKTVVVKRFTKGGTCYISYDDIKKLHGILDKLRQEYKQTQQQKEFENKKRDLIVPFLEALTTDTISFEDVQHNKFTIKLKTGTGNDMYGGINDDGTIETPALQLKYRLHQRVSVNDLQKLIEAHQVFIPQLLNQSAEIMQALPKEWFKSNDELCPSASR